MGCCLRKSPPSNLAKSAQSNAKTKGNNIFVFLIAVMSVLILFWKPMRNCHMARTAKNTKIFQEPPKSRPAFKEMRVAEEREQGGSSLMVHLGWCPCTLQNMIRRVYNSHGWATLIVLEGISCKVNPLRSSRVPRKSQEESRHGLRRVIVTKRAI